MASIRSVVLIAALPVELSSKSPVCPIEGEVRLALLDIFDTLET
jgi:hypothetical protein